MTIAEIDRAIKSYNRRKKTQQQEQASFDYILADLIGRSVARVYSKNNNYPEIAAVYPTLFNAEEIDEKKAEKQDALSAIKFKQFAIAHNKKYEGANEN